MTWLVLALGCAREKGPRPQESPDPTASDEPVSCGWEGSSPVGPREGCEALLVGHDVTVSELVIEAGTVFELEEGVVIRVEWSLEAKGKEASPIAFRPRGAARWGGIDLYHGGQSYASYENRYDGAGRFELSNVEIAGAGAGARPALTINGAVETCTGHECSPEYSELVADRLVVRDAVADGITGDGVIIAESPIGFADVAGYLLRVEQRALETDLVDDLGGNALPAIELSVDPAWFYSRRWGAQAVPLHLVTPFTVGWRLYDFLNTQDLDIEANHILVAPGVGITVDGGTLTATDVTFGPLVPGNPWNGIVGMPDLYVEYDDYYGDDAARWVVAGLVVDGCTLEGTTSPALDWSGSAAPPRLSGTTVREVDAPPGEDVCVATCGNLLEPALGNTLACTIPVDCR
jgi:hypothetical protein